MKMYKYIRRKTSILFTPILFILFLASPTINEWLSLFPQGENTEKRALASFPIINYDSIDVFPKEFNTYYNDNFNPRNHYLNIHNYLNFKYLKNLTTNKVHAGDKGWLFYNNKYLPSRRHKIKIDEEILTNIASELNHRDSLLQTMNCKLFVAIIPAKASIYPEYTNTSPLQGEVQFSLNNTLNFIRKRTDVPIINLSDTLLKSKGSYPLYFKHDHHWNHLGGFISSSMILDTVKKYVNTYNPLNFDNFHIKEKDRQGGDLASLCGVKNFLHENVPTPVLNSNTGFKKVKASKKRDYKAPEKFAYKWGYQVCKKTNNDTLPDLMVLRDSYGSYITTPLSYGFNNSIFIWDAWEYDLNLDILTKEKPDVLLIAIPENSLSKLANPYKPL
jgi:hypothetical protein